MIRTAHASGPEIEAIIKRLEPALEGCETAHVLMACLSLSLVMQHPNITPAQLVEGVNGASQWITKYLAAIDPEDLDSFQNLPSTSIN